MFLNHIDYNFDITYTVITILYIQFVILFKLNLALMRGVLRYMGISKMYIYQNKEEGGGREGDCPAPLWAELIGGRSAFQKP